MSVFVRTSMFVALLLGIAATPSLSLSLSLSRAQESGPIRVTSGVQYEFLERWDVDRLNRVRYTQVRRNPVAFNPARKAVRLYRITTPW